MKYLTALTGAAVVMMVGAPLAEAGGRHRHYGNHRHYGYSYPAYRHHHVYRSYPRYYYSSYPRYYYRTYPRYYSYPSYYYRGCGYRHYPNFGISFVIR